MEKSLKNTREKIRTFSRVINIANQQLMSLTFCANLSC